MLPDDANAVFVLNNGQAATVQTLQNGISKVTNAFVKALRWVAQCGGDPVMGHDTRTRRRGHTREQFCNTPAAWRFTSGGYVLKTRSADTTQRTIELLQTPIVRGPAGIAGLRCAVCSVHGQWAVGTGQRWTLDIAPQAARSVHEQWVVCSGEGRLRGGCGRR